MKLQGSCHCKAVSFEAESNTPYPFMYCYCSICRKTAGGGGFAVNIMAEANSLKVKGEQAITIYHAILSRESNNIPKEVSEGKRHFCKYCASCLWISDSRWPKWIYPFASAIDTSLPIPPERICNQLAYAPRWCAMPKSAQIQCFAEFTDESIEDWHKRHHLLII